MIVKYFLFLFSKSLQEEELKLKKRGAELGESERLVHEINERLEAKERRLNALEARLNELNNSGPGVAFDFVKFGAVSVERVPQKGDKAEHTLIGFVNSMVEGAGSDVRDSGHPYYFFINCTRAEHRELVSGFRFYLKNKKR